MLGKYSQLADDQWEFSVAGTVKDELDLAIIQLLGLHDVTIIRRKCRMMLLERFHRENDVICTDRLAIVPFGLCPQTISHPGEIVGVTDSLGKDAVFGRSLIERSRRKGLIDKLNGAGDRALHARDHQVEVVKGSQGNIPDDSAL